MAKKKSSRRVVAKEVAALLRKIKKTDVLSAYALSDHLTANTIPLAKTVAAAVERHRTNVADWKTTDTSRRRRSRHEIIASWDHWLCRRILSVFGPVTTAVPGVDYDKVIDRKLARLRELRKKSDRLEGVINRSAAKLTRLARSRAPRRLFDMHVSGSYLPGDALAAGDVVVVRKKVAGRIVAMGITVIRLSVPPVDDTPVVEDLTPAELDAMAQEVAVPNICGYCGQRHTGDCG